MSPSAEQIDLLIVGGGIAGIAIAERAARQAKRLGRTARIIVAEREPMLAMGTSSRLQGWFHSGALYCRLESEQSIAQCLDSARTLVDNYGPDSDFLARANCNAAVPTRPEDPAQNWFGEPIDFLIQPPSADASAADRMLRRIDSAWTDATGSPDHERPPGDQPQAHLRVRTPDREMRTYNIARDLTRSAESMGVRFLVNATVVTPDDPETLITTPDATLRVRPRRTILTIGPSVAALHQVPDECVTLRSGIILTARSSVHETNFAVLASDPADNFSHITHGCTKSGKPHVYSAMSDSTAIHQDSSHAQCEAIARRILDKAKARFGAAAFHKRTFAWHACTKIEPIDPASNAPVFAPVHRDLDASGRVTAIIPAKFSLFPNAAEHAVVWLNDSGFFETTPSKPATEITPPHPAPIASPLSAALVGIVPPQTSRLPSGMLAVTNTAAHPAG